MSGSSWKVAYADFVTAMMAFFLLMWILNAATEETKAGLSDFFTSGGMGVTGDLGPGLNLPMNVPVEFYDIARDTRGKSLSEEEIRQVHEEIADTLARFMLDTGLAANSNGISTSNDGVLMTLTSDIMFEPNSVELTEIGKKTLDEVVHILDTHVVSLIIRGHTSSDESGYPFSSRWDLASARANASLAYIQAHSSVTPSYLRSASYADTHPRYPEVDEETRRINRRVEFYFFSPQLASGLRDF